MHANDKSMGKPGRSEARRGKARHGKAGRAGDPVLAGLTQNYARAVRGPPVARRAEGSEDRSRQGGGGGGECRAGRAIPMAVRAALRLHRVPLPPLPDEQGSQVLVRAARARRAPRGRPDDDQDAATARQDRDRRKVFSGPCAGPRPSSPVSLRQRLGRLGSRHGQKGPQHHRLRGLQAHLSEHQA